MAIVKPTDMDFSNKNIVIIVTGMPGTGKTTLALSAPDVLLIDADEGVARVKPEHRRDTSVCAKYEDLLADVKSAKGVYKTIAIDTGGALIEMLKDWAMRTDPKASKSSGGISLQGFGIVKAEFLRLFAELRKNFNVVLLFHESKDKQGDEVFYDIVCEGSAKTLVWQPADLGAHLHIINGKRYLGFTPTMNYNAKSAYGIKGVVEVPELKDGEPNDFLTRLFERVRANIAAEAVALKKQHEEYERAMEAGRSLIDNMQNPEDAIDTLNAIRALPHALTSQKELENMFKAKVKDMGWEYSREAKAYVAKAEQTE